MILGSVILATEVSDSLVAGRPIVALESTVIAQGLPWPRNEETARAVEAAVRGAGATPATIAVLDGKIRVGLTDAERAVVSRPSQPPFLKANRRDLSAVIASDRSAATTVSATVFVARRAGLRPGVMATGGLGGVHRDAASSFDVSTDLDELARADGVLVVCSGFKSILDLPATLESMETRGVVVVGYQTDELPGFLTATSGLALEHRVDTPEEAAELVRAHRALGLPGAIVLAQPVPSAASLDRAALDRALAGALGAAASGGVAGKPLTPYLLDAIRQATGGDALAANCALLIANARLAAQVAVALGQG